MPDKTYISQIKLPSGTVYDIKDAEARELIEGLGKPTHFIGETTSTLVDGATTNPITIDGKSVTAASGDIVVYQNSEFIFDGTKWILLGDLSGLKALAYKDSASGTYTPAGSVSTPTFSGDSLESTGSYTPAGTIELTTTATTVVSGVDKSTGAVQGMKTAGSVTAGAAASLGAGFVTDGTAASATFTEGAFTPNVPTVIDTTKFNGGSAATFTEGAFSAGTLPSFSEGAFTQGTLPELTTSVSNEILTIGFDAGSLPTKAADTWSAGTLPSKAADTFNGGAAASLGAGFYTAGTAASKAEDSFSFTANVPTAVDVSKFDGGSATSVTLPTFEEKTFVTDVTATSGSQNIPTGATFTGTAGTVAVSGTPTGTVSQPSFTGTEATITVS